MARGRKKGQPNLEKVRGGLRNQHGVTFTEGQKKAVELATRRLRAAEKKTGVPAQAMTMQQFRSLNQFEAYIRRSGGSDRLRKVPGGFQNKYGVTFTEAQKQAIEAATKRSNLIRGAAIRKEKKEALMTQGRKQGDKSQLRLMGKENEFIISRQDSSLQRFRSVEEFEGFLRKQERIHSGEYVRDKARLYKRNFMDSLLATYGEEAMDIVMKVRMMKPEEYIKLVGQNEVLEIRFVPSDQKISGRLNQLRDALGMKRKDEWPDEEIEV